MEQRLEVIKLKQDAESAKEIQAMRAEEQYNITNNAVSNIISSNISYIQYAYDTQNIALSSIITLHMITMLEKAMENEKLIAMTPQKLIYRITDTIKQIDLLMDEAGEK